MNTMQVLAVVFGTLKTAALVAAPLLSEMLVGAVLGFGARVILSAAEGAGDLIGYQTGMSMSQVLHPLTNQSLNPIALLEGTVATQVFIARWCRRCRSSRCSSTRTRRGATG